MKDEGLHCLFIMAVGALRMSASYANAGAQHAAPIHGRRCGPVGTKKLTLPPPVAYN